MIRNRAGCEMRPGHGGSGDHQLYCGRRLGTAAIPGSNGECGPTNGPQCADCASAMPHNRAGAMMRPGTGSGLHRLYCGRDLGAKNIPGTDGRCGPNNGNQCADCAAGPASKKVNL